VGGTIIWRPGRAQFKKKKEPKKHRYDSYLSAALDYGGQNPAREQGEAPIRQAADEIRLAAAVVDGAKYAAITRALHALVGQGLRLCYTSQTLGEF
jgi:hypothetical protein